MGLKDALDNVAKTLVTAVDNAVDAASEARHRTEAAGERAKREIAGDDLSPADTAKSLIDQTKHETLANVDAAKREIRQDA